MGTLLSQFAGEGDQPLHTLVIADGVFYKHRVTVVANDQRVKLVSQARQGQRLPAFGAWEIGHGQAGGQQCHILEPGMVVVAGCLVRGIEHLRSQQLGVFEDGCAQAHHEAGIELLLRTNIPDHQEREQPLGGAMVIPGKLPVLVGIEIASFQPVTGELTCREQGGNAALLPCMQHQNDCRMQRMPGKTIGANSIELVWQGQLPVPIQANVSIEWADPFLQIIIRLSRSVLEALLHVGIQRIEKCFGKRLPCKTFGQPGSGLVVFMPARQALDLQGGAFFLRLSFEIELYFLKIAGGRGIPVILNTECQVVVPDSEIDPLTSSGIHDLYVAVAAFECVAHPDVVELFPIGYAEPKVQAIPVEATRHLEAKLVDVRVSSKGEYWIAIEHGSACIAAETLQVERLVDFATVIAE